MSMTREQVSAMEASSYHMDAADDMDVDVRILCKSHEEARAFIARAAEELSRLQDVVGEEDHAAIQPLLAEAAEWGK